MKIPAERASRAWRAGPAQKEPGDSCTVPARLAGMEDPGRVQRTSAESLPTWLLLRLPDRWRVTPPPPLSSSPLSFCTWDGSSGHPTPKLFSDYMLLIFISNNEWSVCLFAQSCLSLYDPMDCSPPEDTDRLLCPWGSPGKNTGVGCHFLPQGIFLTQGLNSDLQYRRQIL